MTVAAANRTMIVKLIQAIADFLSGLCTHRTDGELPKQEPRVRAAAAFLLDKQDSIHFRDGVFQYGTTDAEL
jgi:hypothetical protein